jgi:hypothetical protein
LGALSTCYTFPLALCKFYFQTDSHHFLRRLMVGTKKLAHRIVISWDSSQVPMFMFCSMGYVIMLL